MGCLWSMEAVLRRRPRAAPLPLRPASGLCGRVASRSLSLAHAWERALMDIRVFLQHRATPPKNSESMILAVTPSRTVRVHRSCTAGRTARAPPARPPSAVSRRCRRSVCPLPAAQVSIGRLSPQRTPLTATLAIRPTVGPRRTAQSSFPRCVVVGSSGRNLEWATDSRLNASAARPVSCLKEQPAVLAVDMLLLVLMSFLLPHLLVVVAAVAAAALSVFPSVSALLA